jgi:hypothetical protein
MKTRKPISFLGYGLLALFLSAGVAQAWHVSGKVVCDANQNGQIDSTDSPLQGIIVAIENAGGTFKAAGMTDATGAFSVELPHSADSYTAYIHPPSVPPGATLLVPAEGYYSFSLTDANQFFEQANFVFNCSTSSPPTGDCGKVTGGGWIDGPSGQKASFGVSGGPDNWGHLNYVDHGSGMHVRSTAVTAYENDPSDEDGRIIRYNVVIGTASLTAVVRVIDRGEPGTHDWFEITLSTGYHAAGELGGAKPGGGNIQLHKCPPGKSKNK